MKTVRSSLVLVTLVACGAVTLGSVGCGDDSTPDKPAPSDTGTVDTGAADTGTDTGTVDTGTPGDGGGDTPDPGCPATPTAVDVTADITTDTTWDCSKVYILKKFVEVKPGAKLTIKAGTVVKGTRGAGTGEATITGIAVLPGAKIASLGTKTQPVVMTSNEASKKRGDWAGLMILGKAKSNHTAATFPEGLSAKDQFKYGSTGADRDDADSSGELHYTRVEWAGYQLSVGNEINAFSFYGVGSGTQLDHLEAYQGFDDSFEWFGGAVNGKYLLAQSGNDDCFDMDNGYRGKLQFIICNRDDVDGGGNGFEVDNDANASDNTPYTQPTIWNATMIGKTDTATTEGGHGFHLRRNTKGTWSNVLAVNWPLSGLFIQANVDSAGAALPGTGAEKNATDGSLVVKNSIISGATKDANSTYSQTYLDDASHGNRKLKLADVKITEVKSTGPNFALQAGSPALTGGAAPTDAFFDVAGKDLVGACGTTCPEFEGWTTFK